VCRCVVSWAVTVQRLGGARRLGGEAAQDELGGAARVDRDGLEPVIVPVTVSVPVTLREPAVFRVTPPAKLCTPLSPATKV
jgi:hypothetical protein